MSRCFDGWHFYVNINKKRLWIICQLTQDTEAVEQDDEELLGDNGQVFLAQSEGLVNQEKNHQTFALTFIKKL